MFALKTINNCQNCKKGRCIKQNVILCHSTSNSSELCADLRHKMVELNSLKYVQKPLVRQANHMQKVVLTVAFEYSDLHYGDS
jgi:hypothetical protein